MSKISNQFIKAVIPAVMSSVVLGTFSIVDGLFIGNKIGDIGLAAINFAYPITAFIQAVGFGIGMGGSVCLSIERGKGNQEKEKGILFQIYCLLLLAGLLLLPILFFLKVPILTLFGTEGETLEMAKEYISVVLIGTFFQIFAQGLVPVVRNFGKNAYTMFAMCTGFAVNLILDYVFIYVLDFSLSGAAWATLIAQLLTAILCGIILLKRKCRPKISLEIPAFFEILLVGFSPFGLFFSPNIVLILINKVTVFYGGDCAVAAYTAVSYITYVAMRLIQGIGDGVQPLLSYYEGYGDRIANRWILKRTFVIMSVITLLITAFCLWQNHLLSGIFGLSDEARIVFENALIYLVSPLFFYGIMRVITAVFYAWKKNKYSAILVYGEPILVSLVVLIAPLFLELNGVWLSAPVSQILLALIGIYLLNRTKKGTD